MRTLGRRERHDRRGSAGQVWVGAIARPVIARWGACDDDDSHAPAGVWGRLADRMDDTHSTSGPVRIKIPAVGRGGCSVGGLV